MTDGRRGHRDRVPVTVRPRQWRFIGALGCAALATVGVLALILSNLSRGPVVLIWLAVLIFPALMVVVTALAARGVRVVPGLHLERDRWFRSPLRVAAGDDTEILFYAAVAGSFSAVREIDSPIGVVDQRWAVVRREGRTVMRLGMRLWRLDDLERIARALPAKLTIDETPITAQAIAKRHPDYYWRIEMRPKLYVTLGVLGVLLLGLVTGAALLLPPILSQIWGTA
jgi:hypothetical protein